MNGQKTTTAGILILALLGMLAAGCQNQASNGQVTSSKVSTETPVCCAADTSVATSSRAQGQVKTSTLVLCTDCGQIEGVQVCCRADMPKCGCGLQKGSPGCCKVTKGSEKIIILCSSCGQFKGHENCCKPGQSTCDKCLLAKGSPGCCKLDKS